MIIIKSCTSGLLGCSVSQLSHQRVSTARLLMWKIYLSSACFSHSTRPAAKPELTKLYLQTHTYPSLPHRDTNAKCSFVSWENTGIHFPACAHSSVCLLAHASSIRLRPWHQSKDWDMRSLVKCTEQSPMLENKIKFL